MHSEVPDRTAGGASPQDALRHADALFSLARHLTGDGVAAEDLVQETYARAFQAWSRLEPASNVKAWLFRILRNVFFSEERRVERRVVTDRGADDADEMPDLAASDAYFRGDIELDRMRRLVAEEIEAALAALPADSRTLILLDLEGFTQSELAEVMGWPLGTVKSRLSRARASLRRCLAQFRREVE
jgi:RNA polymerase sigma-70 factor (ECF subfamily)